MSKDVKELQSVVSFSLFSLVSLTARGRKTVFRSIGAAGLRGPYTSAGSTLDCESKKGEFVSCLRKACLQSSQPFFRDVLSVFSGDINFCGR